MLFNDLTHTHGSLCISQVQTSPGESYVAIANLSWPSPHETVILFRWALRFRGFHCFPGGLCTAVMGWRYWVEWESMGVLRR